MAGGKKVLVLADPAVVPPTTAHPRVPPFLNDPASASVSPPQTNSGSLHELRLRTCFWKVQLKQADVKSVAEEVERGKQIWLGDYDAIFVSWDTANGDPSLQSDATLEYFQRIGRVRFADAARNRGRDRGLVLFCECQTVAGLPVQAAYDAIFGAGELTVNSGVAEQRFRRGERAKRARKYWKHPLLCDIDELAAQYRLNGLNPDESLFARDDVDDEDDFLSGGDPLSNFPESIWCGYFVDWRREWIPLLYAKPTLREFQAHRPAVMLAKIQSDGILVASTLWIAAVPPKTVVENLLTDDLLKRCRPFHRRMRRRRLMVDALITVLLAAAVFALSYLLFQVVVKRSLGNTTDKIVSAIGITIYSIVNLFLLRIGQFIVRRPPGISPIYRLRRPVVVAIGWLRDHREQLRRISGRE